MRDLYATTLQLVHIGGGGAFELAAERAVQWAWRLDEPQPSWESSPSGHAVDSAAGVRVDWSSFGSSAARAVEVRLQHPDDTDPTLYWQATIEIAEIGGATKASLRLALGASVFSLKPLKLSLRAPSLVQELMRAPLRASAGTMELEAGPKVLRDAEVRPLVRDVLRAEGRALPILVIASEVDQQLVGGLSRATAGLVQVVRAYDSRTDEVLRAELEPTGFTVPRGGLRLFWPEFDSVDEGGRSPYWTSAEIRAGGRGRESSVVNQLVNLLAPISTARVPLDRGVLRARQESLRQRQKEQQDREEAQRSRARRQRENRKRAKQEQQELVDGEALAQAKGSLAEMEGLLELAEKERDDADARAAKADKAEAEAIEEALAYSERVEALKSEVSGLRRAIRTMNEYEPAAEGEESEEAPMSEDLSSWEEVAHSLPDLEGPGFVLTDNATACADPKNRYPHPGGMWKSLKALEKVGRVYNEMGANVGKRFEDFALEIAGIEVALQDSTYPDCWFEYDGEWFERVPHVKIDDAKAPNEVGRIYFGLDPEGRRVIVDWFGTKPDRPHSKRVDRAAA